MENFVLIIGSMKCGTTSLFDYLSQHPQICHCSIKEPNFFASDENWQKGFDWYQNLWEWNPKQHTIALEASTHYTKIPKFPNAAERIAQTPANFKFIYMMRNPLDRIESHYNHGQAVGWSTTRNNRNQTIDRQLIEVSNYTQQITEYYQRFPAQNIMLLDFEQLKNEPFKLLEKVSAFLNLEPNYSWQNLDKVLNAGNQRIAYPKWWQFLKLTSRYIPMPHALKIWSRGFFGTKNIPKFTLSAEQKKYIYQELHEDLIKLEQKYGFNISGWSIKD